MEDPSLPPQGEEEDSFPPLGGDLLEAEDLDRIYTSNHRRDVVQGVKTLVRDLPRYFQISYSTSTDPRDSPSYYTLEYVTKKDVEDAVLIAHKLKNPGQRRWTGPNRGKSEVMFAMEWMRQESLHPVAMHFFENLSKRASSVEEMFSIEPPLYPRSARITDAFFERIVRQLGTEDRTKLDGRVEALRRLIRWFGKTLENFYDVRNLYKTALRSAVSYFVDGASDGRGKYEFYKSGKTMKRMHPLFNNLTSWNRWYTGSQSQYYVQLIVDTIHILEFETIPRITTLMYYVGVMGRDVYRNMYAGGRLNNIFLYSTLFDRYASEHRLTTTSDVKRMEKEMRRKTISLLTSDDASFNADRLYSMVQSFVSEFVKKSSLPTRLEDNWSMGNEYWKGGTWDYVSFKDVMSSARSLQGYVSREDPEQAIHSIEEIKSLTKEKIRKRWIGSLYRLAISTNIKGVQFVADEIMTYQQTWKLLGERQVLDQAYPERDAENVAQIGRYLQTGDPHTMRTQLIEWRRKHVFSIDMTRRIMYWLKRYVVKFLKDRSLYLFLNFEDMIMQNPDAFDPNSGTHVVGWLSSISALYLIGYLQTQLAWKILFYQQRFDLIGFLHMVLPKKQLMGLISRTKNVPGEGPVLELRSMFMTREERALTSTPMPIVYEVDGISKEIGESILVDSETDAVARPLVDAVARPLVEEDQEEPFVF
jgi:hypothetical protein